MRSRLSTRSIGGLVDPESVAVEVSFGDEPAAAVDAPAVEEKGPPALPPTVGRSLMNLETFIAVFVLVVLLIFEVSVPFVLGVGLVVGGGWAALRIRIVSPDEVV